MKLFFLYQITFTFGFFFSFSLVHPYFSSSGNVQMICAFSVWPCSRLLFSPSQWHLFALMHKSFTSSSENENIGINAYANAIINFITKKKRLYVERKKKLEKRKEKYGSHWNRAKWTHVTRNESELYDCLSIFLSSFQIETVWLHIFHSCCCASHFRAHVTISPWYSNFFFCCCCQCACVYVA